MIQYVIKAGDTLFSIAQRYGLSVSQLLAANPQITNPSLIYVGQIITIQTPQNLPTEYIVRPGDSFSIIARRFGITVERLLTANPQVTNPDRIAVGQWVSIPSPTPFPGIAIYIVQSGETLYIISRKFNTTAERILKLNPQLPSSGAVRPGQRILVPLPEALVARGCILFDSNRTGKTELWMTDPLGKNQIQLTGKPGRPQQVADNPAPKWSPYGMRAAFFAGSRSARALHIMDVCGSNEREIASSANSFLWSHDGKRIAYSNDQGTFITVLDGTTQKISDWLQNPVWFPDDKALAGYTTVDGVNYSVMASVDITGQNFTVYDNPLVPAAIISLSPDGHYAATQLLSGSASSVVSGVWIYEFTSKSLVRLPGTEFTPQQGSSQNISVLGAWSPYSSMLVYSSLLNQNGYAEIKIVNPQGELVQSFRRGYYPKISWGPTLEEITFSLSENPGTSALQATFPRNIYVMNVRTVQQVKTTGLGNNDDPDWNGLLCPGCS